MFCSNCGFQMGDNDTFCMNCGAKKASEANAFEQYSAVDTNQPVTEPVIEQVPVVEEQVQPVVEQAPIVETVMASETVDAEVKAETEVQTAVEVQTSTDDSDIQNNAEQSEGQDNNVTETPAKKKKKFPWWILIVLAIVAAIVCFVVFNFNMVAGFFVKTFGSDSDYMQFVERNTLKSYATAATEVYGNATSEEAKESQSLNANGSFTVELGDGLEELLKENGVNPDDLNIDWLEKAAVDFNATINEGKISAEYGLVMNDKDILTFIICFDTENSEMYMSVPQLTDKTVKIEMKDMNTEATDVYEMMDEIMEALPDEKTLKSLLVKYIKVATECINDAELSSTTIKAGGVEQSCTEIEFECDELFLAEACLAIVQEAKDDKDIKQLLDDIQEFGENNDLFDDVDLYDEFMDALDDAEEELEDIIDDLDGDEGDVLFVLTDYVNYKSEIIGRKIEDDDGNDLFFYCITKKGSNVGFVLEIDEDDFVIEGNGTLKGSKVSGELDVEYYDEDICKIALEDVKLGKVKKGELSGKIIVTTDISDIADYVDEFILDFDITEKKATIKVSALKNDKLIAAVSMNGEMSDEAEDVKIPDENLIDGKDEEALNNLLNGIDIEAFKKSLLDAGIPSDIVDLIFNDSEGNVKEESNDDYDDVSRVYISSIVEPTVVDEINFNDYENSKAYDLCEIYNNTDVTLIAPVINYSSDLMTVNYHLDIEEDRYGNIILELLGTDFVLPYGVSKCEIMWKSLVEYHVSGEKTYRFKNLCIVLDDDVYFFEETFNSPYVEDRLQSFEYINDAS